MLSRENKSDNCLQTKRSHSFSAATGLNFHLIICNILLALTWQFGGAFAQRYYRRHHLLFDCRRIHPQYCCSPRVRYNCPELCAGHTCQGGSAQQRQLPTGFAVQQQRSFGGGEQPSGWPPPPPLPPPTSQIGNFLPPSPPRPSVQPPNGLILPPPDVPPAIIDFSGGNIDSGGHVPMLPAIDSTSVAVVNSAAGKRAEEAVTPFPTLIPWNVVSAIGRTENSMVSSGTATLRPQGPYPPAIAPPNQGSVDGEIQVGGSSASHIGRPNGVLPPPHLPRSDGSSPLSPEEAGALEELEHFANKPMPTTDGEEGIELIITESGDEAVSPPIDNIPPTPVHPETTWVPLSINVRPSVSRTTASESSTFTTIATTPLSTTSSLTDQLSISFGNGNTPDHGLIEVLPSEKSVEIARLSSKAAASFGRFSLTRRGDLPLTPSGDGSNGAESFNKMVVTGSKKMASIINVVSTTKNVTTMQGSINSTCTEFDAIVDHVFSQKTIDAITAAANGAGLGRRHSKTRTSATSSTTPLSSLPTSLSTTTTKTAATISTFPRSEAKKCGVAPDFTPCVPLEQANQKLMACCQQRLPPGCLDLCRYNVTQAEIKRQFDAGKCGILSVAPYLECASQAQDNLSCCRHRGVAAKSGSHCEVFCHPSKGLGILGLQHLACQTVIGDLIHCHYAGLPPLKTDF